MIDPWCPLLSNGYRFESAASGNLTYSPCCWIYSQEFVDRWDLFKIKNSTRYFANKDCNKYCSSCITRESAGKSSMRQQYSNIMKGFADNQLFVEVATDTRCNAACIMCGPQLSTTWQKEIGIPILTTEKQQETSAELITKSIDIQKVRFWNFVGGEPLLVSTHKKIIKRINDLSDVMLTYHTNGSIAPDDETLNLWRQAKSCLVWFSIDGTGKQFEYIRYPLLWDSVLTNIENFLYHVSKSSNLYVGIHVTVSPLNLLYLSDITDCFDNLAKSTGVKIKVEYDICVLRFDLSGCPPSLREQAAKIYKPDHMVLNFLKQLPYNQDYAKQLVSEATALDQRRNLNWRDVFPLASKHFETL